MIDRIERLITSWSPESRRRVAIHMFIWSLVLMVANVVAYALGALSQSGMILVTLILSWLAITLTAADLVSTTDVRAEEDDAD